MILLLNISIRENTLLTNAISNAFQQKKKRFSLFRELNFKARIFESQINDAFNQIKLREPRARIYIHPYIASTSPHFCTGTKRDPSGVHNLFRLQIAHLYVTRGWRLKAVGDDIFVRADSKQRWGLTRRGERKSEGVRGREGGKGSEWGELASGRLIFRAINAPVVLVLLSVVLSKRVGDDTSDLLQVPDDGYEIDLCGQRWDHLFHSRDPAHCLHVPAAREWM